jgi:hypothetical protein
MSTDSTEWVVIVYRRHADGVLRPEVLEVRDEITAQRYFDKLSAGSEHVRMLQARVTRTLGDPAPREAEVQGGAA